MLLQDVKYRAGSVGISVSDEGVMRLLRVGSGQLAAYRSCYEQQLEAQGIDPCWTAPQDAAEEEAANSSKAGSSSSSSSRGKGRSRMASRSSGMDVGEQQQVQQQWPADLASAIKLAGQSIL